MKLENLAQAILEVAKEAINKVLVEIGQYAVAILRSIAVTILLGSFATS